MSAPRQLAKRQRLERKRRRKREALRRRQEKQPPVAYAGDSLETFPAVGGPVGGVKMSKVLESFVAPLLHQVDGYRAHSTLISMGVVAWNAALEPDYRRAAFVSSAIDAAMKHATLQERLEGRELIEGLIARKLQHFANYHRPIFGYQLDELEGGGFYLSVASGLC
jgi:hypothetical protein